MDSARRRAVDLPRNMAPNVKTIDVAGNNSADYASPTITSSREIVHAAGQAGVSRQGLLPPDYESQIHLAMLNIHRILVASNSSVTDILKLTLYIVNYDPSQRKHAKIVQNFLGKHQPEITLVPVSQLAVPGRLFEMDAVISRALTHVPRLLTTTENVDVIIIGAGLAGLTAAQHIVKAGYSCRILEARNRVGGRTWSQKQATGGVIDVGAAWINDTNQSRMIALARQFNAELVKQNTNGSVILESDGLKEFPYGELPGVSLAIVM